MAIEPVTGQVAVTATAAVLSSTILELGLLIIKADIDNTDEVFLGAAGVTTATGFSITPGETHEISYDNIAGLPIVEPRADKLYVVGVAGDRISWLGWER